MASPIPFPDTGSCSLDSSPDCRALAGVNSSLCEEMPEAWAVKSMACRQAGRPAANEETDSTGQGKSRGHPRGSSDMCVSEHFHTREML